MVVNMVWAVEKGSEELTMAMLWLVSYLFLLRVPSEVSAMLHSGLVRPVSTPLAGAAHVQL